MTQKLKTLIIDEKRWYKGKGSEYSRLYRPSDKKMCCLGFLGRECGYKASELCDIGFPSTLIDLCFSEHKWPELITKLQIEIASINDNDKISDKERKKKLHPLFKQMGYNLKFINCERVEKNERI